MKKLLLLLLILALSCSPFCGCQSDPKETASAQPPLEPVSTLRVICFAAGKADAFLFWNDAGAVLIDTGESGFGKTITEKLSELGVRELHTMIVTHFDKDHVGGAKKVLETLPVGQVLQSNCPKTGAKPYEKYLAALSEAGITPVTVRREMVVSLGDVRFTVNPPAKDRYADDPSNNSSLIVTVEHGANRMLFTGDAEEARLREFLAGEPGTCELVKLPHHGAWDDALALLLQKTEAGKAIVTCSNEEPEDERTAALLAREGVEVWLTRIAPIEIVSNGKSLALRYE